MQNYQFKTKAMYLNVFRQKFTIAKNNYFEANSTQFQSHVRQEWGKKMHDKIFLSEWLNIDNTQQLKADCFFLLNLQHLQLNFQILQLARYLTKIQQQNNCIKQTLRKGIIQQQQYKLFIAHYQNVEKYSFQMARQLWNIQSKNQEKYWKQNCGQSKLNGKQNIKCQFCKLIISQNSFTRHLKGTHFYQIKKKVQLFKQDPQNSGKKYRYSLPQIIQPQFTKLHENTVILLIKEQSEEVCAIQPMVLHSKPNHHFVQIFSVQVNKQCANVIQKDPLFHQLKDILIQSQQEQNLFDYQNAYEKLLLYFQNYAIQYFGKIKSKHPYSCKQFFNIGQLQSIKNRIKIGMNQQITRKSFQQVLDNIYSADQDILIKGRQNQCNKIKNFINKQCSQAESAFMHIVGGCGVGKSTVLSYLMKSSPDKNIIKINAFGKTRAAIFKQMVKSSSKSVTLNLQGLMHLSNLLNNKKKIIFILDDADSVSVQVIKQLTQLKNMHFIIVTNNPQKIEAKVYMQYLMFMPYNLQAITEIIMYRFGDTIFDSSAVKLICSKFSRHSFDIRIIIRFIADLLDQYIHTCQEQHTGAFMLCKQKVQAYMKQDPINVFIQGQTRPNLKILTRICQLQIMGYLPAQPHVIRQCVFSFDQSITLSSYRMHFIDIVQAGFLKQYTIEDQTNMPGRNVDQPTVLYKWDLSRSAQQILGIIRQHTNHQSSKKHIPQHYYGVSIQSVQPILRKLSYHFDKNH